MASDVRSGDLHQELTIVAVSSGAPPAAIGIIRVSGSRAFTAATALCGTLPDARSARVRALHDPADGNLLDLALVIAFPGPATATGEDLVELHCHGGRAVLAAVEAALVRQPGCRAAEPGEFTRRALLNGRIDLAQAEALGELLAAETDAQRRSALLGVEGALGRAVLRWQAALLHQAALIEAALAFEDEREVGEGNPFDRAAIDAVRQEIAAMLARPPAERLRDGIRVVLAGPPNAGKSTLLNAMVGRDAAIVSPLAGTTRDRIEAPVQHGGIPYLLTDTAGLRDMPGEAIEAEGIARAEQAVATADLVLWLGDTPAPSTEAGVIALWPRHDEPGRGQAPPDRLAISATTGSGMAALWQRIGDHARALLPYPGEVALNRRQQALLALAAESLAAIAREADELLVAEHLRAALRYFDRITGRAGTEAVLDDLFATFCLGK